jgi:hypothetical protein
MPNNCTQGRWELFGGMGQICFGGPYLCPYSQLLREKISWQWRFSPPPPVDKFLGKKFSGQQSFNCFRGTFPNIFHTKFRPFARKTQIFRPKITNISPEKQKYFAPQPGAWGNSPHPPLPDVQTLRRMVVCQIPAGNRGYGMAPDGNLLGTGLEKAFLWLAYVCY